MSYEAIWGRDAVYVRFWGRASSRELAESSRRGQADPRFSQLRFVLYDFLACTGADFDVVLMEELAATDWAASLTNPHLRTAAVAAHPEIEAMAAAYAHAARRFVPSADLSFRTFRTISESILWLHEATAGHRRDDALAVMGALTVQGRPTRTADSASR